MTSHMTDRENGPVSTGYIPSGRLLPESRRNFRLSDKKRIVAEAMAPGASVSGVARRYGIAPRVLFRWKQELAPPPPEPVFLSVMMSDGLDADGAPSHQPAISMPVPAAAPMIVERPRDEIEIELVGGRRMRFARDADPATLQAMIAMLEWLADLRNEILQFPNGRHEDQVDSITQFLRWIRTRVIWATKIKVVWN